MNREGRGGRTCYVFSVAIFVKHNEASDADDADTIQVVSVIEH